MMTMRVFYVVVLIDRSQRKSHLLLNRPTITKVDELAKDKTLGNLSKPHSDIKTVIQTLGNVNILFVTIVGRETSLELPLLDREAAAACDMRREVPLKMGVSETA